MPKLQIYNLDAIRILTAFWIMALHYSYTFQMIYKDLDHVEKLGGYIPVGGGVNFFLIISGLLIPGSMARAGSIWKFVVARASRLYPAYWVCLLITFAVTHILTLPGREISVTDLLVNFSMLQKMIGIPSADVTYWTLQVFLYFYFWIVLAYACRCIKQIHWIFIGLVFLGLLQKIFGVIDLLPAGAYRVQELILYGHAIYFLVGIMLTRIERKNTPLFILVALLFLIDRSLFLGVKGKFAVAIFQVFIMLACLRWKVAFFDNLFCKKLAGSTYALYLVHANVGYAIIHFAHRQGIHPAYGIGIAVITLVPLALAINQWIEPRGKTWMLKLAGKN